MYTKLYAMTQVIERRDGLSRIYAAREPAATFTSERLVYMPLCLSFRSNTLTLFLSSLYYLRLYSYIQVYIYSPIWQSNEKQP